jgi:hypothetical protein
MHPKKFALIGGIIMLAIGALALIPSLYQYQSAAFDLPMLKNETSYGLFLGLFPMNIFNKIAMIVFGVAGILAANAPTTNLPKSILFSRIVFFVMGAAAILGLIPATNTLGGYWPLFGNEVWMHGVFALVGAYFGFALSSVAKRENDKAEERDRKAAIKHRPIGV